MTQHRAHRIHLRMAGCCIAAVAMNFFENNRCSRKIKSRPAITLRNHGSEIALFHQCTNKLFRIELASIAIPPILAGKRGANLGNAIADFSKIRIDVGKVHLATFFATAW